MPCLRCAGWGEVLTRELSDEERARPKPKAFEERRPTLEEVMPIITAYRQRNAAMSALVAPKADELFVAPSQCEHCGRPTDQLSPTYIGPSAEGVTRPVKFWCKVCLKARDRDRAEGRV
jgi:hypothetical protein